MMAKELRVRYAREARSDLDKIEAYISDDDPYAAARVIAAVESAVDLLAHYPRKSRKTTQRGMRALPLSGYPYIIFFKVKRGELEVLHVLHGARRHPDFQEEPPGYLVETA